MEEIINFTGVIQEKKFQILHKNTKINDAISFVDEEASTPNKNKRNKDKIDDINHVQMVEEDVEMQDQNNSL